LGSSRFSAFSPKWQSNNATRLSYDKSSSETFLFHFFFKFGSGKKIGIPFVHITMSPLRRLAEICNKGALVGGILGRLSGPNTSFSCSGSSSNLPSNTNAVIWSQLCKRNCFQSRRFKGVIERYTRFDRTIHAWSLQWIRRPRPALGTLLSV
jgi:hypothetical protein